MKDKLRKLALENGASDDLLIAALCKTVEDQFIKSDINKKAFIKDVIKNLDTVREEDLDPDPEKGDLVYMHDQDVAIEIEEVPLYQSEIGKNIWQIKDQYGEIHRIEYDFESKKWFAVVEGL
jgi:hypothetical protein